MAPLLEAMDPDQQVTLRQSRLPPPGKTGLEQDHNTALPDALRNIFVKPEPLTRQLSDLSGSYVNGSNPGMVSVRVPGIIQVPTGGWRQAYVISKPPPSTSTRKAFPSFPSSIGVPRCSGIVSQRDEPMEVVQQKVDEEETLDTSEVQRDNQIPVTVILMDGSKHTYELLQVWIDRAVDSVRDVIRAVQRGIPSQWKIAYDGIFQVRGNRFTQLIHILRMNKYDIQPHEILVAKPRAMIAKIATSSGNSVIRHLTSIQIIKTHEEDTLGQRFSMPEGGPLVLSKLAQERIYAPDSVLSHHHATQVLTFSPPFESMTCLGESSYSCDDAVSTLGSNTSSVTGPVLQGHMVADLIASLLPTCIDEQAASGFAQKYKKSAQVTSKPEPQAPYDLVSHGSAGSILSRNNLQAIANYASSSRRNNVSLVMSQLNCFKSRELVAALACCPSKGSQVLPTSGCICRKMKDWNHHHPPLHTVREEEVGHDKPESSSYPTSQHRRTKSQPDSSLPTNQHRRTKLEQQRSSEALWISSVELDENDAKYVTRGTKRFLRVEI